jgi:hypothetical protein
VGCHKFTHKMTDSAPPEKRIKSVLAQAKEENENAFLKQIFFKKELVELQKKLVQVGEELKRTDLVIKEAGILQCVEELLNAPHEKKLCLVVPRGAFDSDSWDLEVLLDDRFDRHTTDEDTDMAQFAGNCTGWCGNNRDIRELEFDGDMDFSSEKSTLEQAEYLKLDAYDCHFHVLMSPAEWTDWYEPVPGDLADQTKYFAQDGIQEWMNDCELDGMYGDISGCLPLYFDYYVEKDPESERRKDDN